MLIDDRTGSKELIQYDALKGIGVLCRLEYGDVTFSGYGPGNKDVKICVELKSLLDLAGSLKSNRLQGHQIPGMVRNYDVQWLLYYGVYRYGDDGNLVVYNSKRKKWTHAKLGKKTFVANSYIDAFLCSPSFRATGVGVHHAHTKEQAAEWLLTLWKTWQRPWNSHKSMDVVYSAPVPGPVRSFSAEDKHARQKAKVAMALARGIGVKKAKSAVDYFASVKDMVNASQEEWNRVKDFGPILSRVVYDFVNKKDR